MSPITTLPSGAMTERLPDGTVRKFVPSKRVKAEHRRYRRAAGASSLQGYARGAAGHGRDVFSTACRMWAGGKLG